MDKFVERAKELIARLSLISADLNLGDKYSALQACIRSHYDDSSSEDELMELDLNVRILLSEFNCPPLYEEACRCSMKPDRLIRLLKKMIETSEFRQR